MSPPGRPKGEYRSAEREGTPMSPPGRHRSRARIRRALPYMAAENIILAPDCGMKYLPRETALGKLKAMVAGAAIMRAELSRAA